MTITAIERDGDKLVIKGIFLIDADQYTAAA